jgi:tetratricopeptide (TPR) repeat protein
MYARQIRCTDCHDPHTARLRSVDPAAPWRHVADNRVCVECHLGQHPAAKYDTPTHDHHPDRSKPGTLCVDCHVPETTYMVVDPRRDHSMRVPRPDLSIALGIPNACNRCHNYGLALQKLGDAAKAEEEFSQAHKLAPEVSDYLRALAILYTQQKRWARAAACAEELVRRQPNEPELQRLLEYARRKGAKP